MKMLLHACCGPCSVMPTKILSDEGYDLTVFYANSNIAPEKEYKKRLDTLRAFAESKNVGVVEGTYNPASWEAVAGKIGKELQTKLEARTDKPQTVAQLLDDEHRKERCRACYRLRLEEAARACAQGGYDVFTTTLAVSPYQFTDVIHEELQRAAGQAGVRAYFQDFRPYYEEGTRLSRQLGMYRQNYCGCRFSIAEGEATRRFIRQQQAERKQEWRAQHANEIAARERALDEQRAKKRAYAEAQAKKRAVLKALRAQNKAQSHAGAATQTSDAE